MIALVGCGAPDESETATETTTVASTDSSSSDSPSAVCMAYLDCIAVLQPALFAESLDAYGPNGTCWSSGEGVEQTCERACMEGLEQLEQLNDMTGEPLPPECGGASPGTTTGATNDSLAPGFHLLVVSLSVAPDLPFQLVMDVPESTDVPTTELQPLSLDVGSQTEPRTPTGDPFLATLSVEGDDVVIELPTPVVLPGDSSAALGSDTVLETTTLVGRVADDGGLCGEVTGELVSPLTGPLAGSTFASVPVTSVLPAELGSAAAALARCQ